MKRVCLLISLIGLGIASFGQDIFKGKVINRENRKSLPYANIGVLHSNWGTCADARGYYTFDLSEFSDRDTLVCSHIGYKSDSTRVGVFRQQHHTGVAIFPLAPLLPPPSNIMDYDDEMTKKVLGIDSDSKSKTTNFVSNSLGSEIGVTIHVKSETTYLRDLSFNVVKNDYDSLLIRVNMYYLLDGMPYDKINSEDIIVRAHDHQGRVWVNLLPYALIVDEDFFVSLEWVTQLGPANNSKLLFTGGSKSHNNYCRKASQSVWIQYNGFGPAIAVTGIYE